MTVKLGPLVGMLHRDGGWVRWQADGPGWCVNGPNLRPLFSERNARGQRVVLTVRGWRLKQDRRSRPDS